MAKYSIPHFSEVFVIVEKKDVDNIEKAWYNKPEGVNFCIADYFLDRQLDILVVCSPHGLHYSKKLSPSKTILHCQMLEHMFRPSDHEWLSTCMDFYSSEYPMIALSRWNIEGMKYFRKGETYYLPGGVDFDDFPIQDIQKDGKTILVEGWEPTNPCKDIDNIGPKVAEIMKSAGYTILAYSGLPCWTLPHIPDEYYCRPSIEQMNDLYRRASILIKASRYDCRATAPLEAGTKGCVTARAIIEGDDDLIGGETAYRASYNQDQLLIAVSNLLEKPGLLAHYRKGIMEHVISKCYWPDIIKQYIAIF